MPSLLVGEKVYDARKKLKRPMTHTHTHNILVKGYENKWNFMLINFVFYGIPDDFKYLCTVKFIFLMLISKQIFWK